MTEHTVLRAPADDPRRPAPTLPPPPDRPTGRLVLGGLLVLAGVLWLLDAAGLELRWRVVLPAVLTLLGFTLIATARGQRHDGPIAAGIVLSVLVLISSAAPAGMTLPPLAGIGDRIERPTSLPETGATYELGMGTLTVDLRGISLPGRGVEVSARVGMGELIVRLPEGAGAEVQAQAGVGEVVILGATRDGVGVSVTEAVTGTPTVVLDLWAGLGKVEVRR